MKGAKIIIGGVLLLAFTACKKDKPTHVPVSTVATELQNPWGWVC